MKLCRKFKKTPFSAGAITEGISPWLEWGVRHMRLLHWVSFMERQCVLAGGWEDEDVLTASSVVRTSPSYCALRPRCDSWGGTSSGPPWNPHGAWVGKTEVHIVPAQENEMRGFRGLNSWDSCGSVITDMLKHEHAVLWTKTEALCSRYTRPHQHLYFTPWESNQTQPENEGRSPCSRPWGCRARGSEVWDTRSWRGLALWRNGTFGGRAPRRTRSGRWWRFACLGWMGQSGSWGGSPSPGPPGVGLALPGTKTNTFRAQGWITYREVFN